MAHTLLVPTETRARLTDYLAALQAGGEHPGKRLGEALAGLDLQTLTEPAFQDALLNTKLPQIFAESAVAGDGSDWNPSNTPNYEGSGPSSPMKVPPGEPVGRVAAW